MKITNGEVAADVPTRLANLLIDHRDWELADESDQAELDEFIAEREAEVEERDEEASPVEEAAEKEVAAVEAKAPVPVVELNNEATCDDDLPDGIVFAESAYTTVVDEETGEKVRVLKTHCRNGHEYAGANVKIRVRDGKAHRECQTCLKARRARANAKEKVERAAEAAK